MKKSTAVAGLVILAGAAYLGATWYVGQQTEMKIRQAVLEANEGAVSILGSNLKNKGLTLSVEEYKRGWFSSDAVYVLSAKDADGKTVEVSFSDHLQHGPFPVSALKAGNFVPMLAYSQAHLLPSTDLQPWFDYQKGAKGDTPLHAETQIRFGGKGSSVWTFAPVDYAKDGDEFAFSGGVITVDFSNDFKDSVTKGGFSNLSMLEQDTADSLSIKDVSISSTSNTKDQTITASSSLTAKQLVLGGSEDLSMENFSMAVNSLQQGTMLDGSAQYKVDRIGAGKADLGSIDITASIARLDMTALSDMVNTYSEHTALEQSDRAEDAELSEQLEARLQEKLMAILATKPQLSISPFTWANSAGKSTASALVELNAPADLQAALEDPVTALTEEVLEKIKLDINVSRPMLIQVIKAINFVDDEHSGEPPVEVLYDRIAKDLGAMGLVQSDEHGLKLDFLYQNNKAVLNGEEIPLQALMMMLMMLAM